MTGVSDLIVAAQTSPPKPIIQGLLNESEIAGLHGAPEVFKTIFCLRLAESLASGVPLLGTWQVPKPQQVYVFETEMSVPALGLRLAKMFAHRTAPERIHFADEARLRKFRRASDLKSKFALLSEWMAEVKPDVLIIDTANPFFRGKESPNDETTAGAFFDLLEATPASVKLFVRHNHKPRIDDQGGDAATKIRGSGQFSDVPDLLLELRRIDKRTNEAALSISKFRHGTKPEDLKLWLDTEELRLVSVPPVIYLLRSGSQSRSELVEGLAKRFGIQQRAADALIKAEQLYLRERMSGHKVIYEIDWSAAPDAEWCGRVQGSRETVGDMQGCISYSFSLATAEEAAPLVLSG
jgi:AAA domain-containing protein